MRVTAEEDQLLSEAAELSHLSKTAFILSAAAERAESVVRAAHTYPLSADAFEAFLAELDRPAEVLPGLAELFARARQAE